MLYAMTWVLGWPINDDFILDFTAKHNLLPGIKDDLENCSQSATVTYIVRATGCRAVCCWVDGLTELVFMLTLYEGPLSKLPTRVDSSELPPRETTARLAKLLGVHHMPHRYLYDDGSLASWEANPYRHLDSDKEDPSSDEEDLSDEEWDSEGDITEAGRSDNEEEGDEPLDDKNDSRGEAEVPHIHKDVAENKPMSALPTTFGECFSNICSHVSLLSISLNVDAQCSI